MSDVKAEADKSAEQQSSKEKSAEEKSAVEKSSNTKIVAAPLDAARFDAKRVAVQMMVGNQFVQPYHFVMTRLKVYGRENIPKEGSLIVVGNHISHFDPPLFAFVTHRPMIYMAKSELWDNKYMGRLLDWLGALPIKRGKPQLSTVKFIRQIMKTGWSLGMFIEGTRCKTPNSIGKPHVGAAYFAKVTNSKILPIGFIGTDKRFGPARVNIGKVIEPGDDLEAKTWEIMDALAELTGFQILERKMADKE
ncbi:1-acyl-sn-glycerol-3-phosphate acyltransferase [bacterium]|jgi:1-acyl-sn-glycerol-3-phosphate acyltransferase|nr:1-acyl-sn-glycerol-3-phosphate acyltransferase [bacterium]